MRDELGVAEAQRLDSLGGLLEVFPARLWQEALRQTGSVAWVRTLVEQGEGHGQRERPGENIVIVPGQKLNVQGDIAALAGAVTVQEHGQTGLVPES